MSVAKQAVATAAALNLLNREKKVETDSRPKNIKEAFLDKPLLWIVVGGIGVYAVYRVYKAVSNAAKSGKGATGENRQDVKQFEKTQVASYPDGQYFGFADAIYAARHGNNLFGTDEDAIWNVMKNMKNDLDVAKLIKAFGERRLSFSTQKAGLGGFLSDELSDSEMENTNSILRSKGIKYQF